DHTHDEDDLDYDAGDFWVHIESSAIPELATEDSGAIWDRHLHLSTSGNVANGTILTTLLFAYIGFHERLLEHHQCSHPDCQMVESVRGEGVRTPCGHLVLDDTVRDKNYASAIGLGGDEYSGNAKQAMKGMGFVPCVYVNPALALFWLINYRI